MGNYKDPPGAGGRKPSIDLRLPLVVRYLQDPMNRLILKLDEAEEREERIEKTLQRIEASLSALLGDPEKREEPPS